MQDQVGLGDLLQRRAERLNQLVRQVPDEPDGVGQREDASVRGLRASGGRVDRGEQRVLDEHARTGEPVEQAGLSGVGVARDRDRRDLVAHPLGLLGGAGGAELLELATQLGDAVVDPAAVRLELRLTGTATTDALAAGRAATGLPGQLATPAAQALRLVPQLREFDLRLALGALGVLGEDVEDQRGAVDDLHLRPVLQVAQLAGRKLAVADDGVGAGGGDGVVQLVDLAASDEGRGVRLLASLDEGVEHLGSGGLGEQLELGQ